MHVFVYCICLQVKSLWSDFIIFYPHTLSIFFIVLKFSKVSSTLYFPYFMIPAPLTDPINKKPSIHLCTD